MRKEAAVDHIEMLSWILFGGTTERQESSWFRIVGFWMKNQTQDVLYTKQECYSLDRNDTYRPDAGVGPTAQTGEAPQVSE
jgi:hypothetical protein